MFCFISLYFIFIFMEIIVIVEIQHDCSLIGCYSEFQRGLRKKTDGEIESWRGIHGFGIQKSRILWKTEF